MIVCSLSFFFNDTATTEIYTYLHTLSLHDALPICLARQPRCLDDSIHRHTIAMLQEHLHSHVQYSPVDLRRSFKTGAAGPLMVWLQQYPLSLLSTILSFFSSIAN